MPIKYTEDYKRRAVSAVVAGELSQAGACRRWGMSRATMVAWMKEFAGTIRNTIGQQLGQLQLENETLKRKVLKLEADNELLKSLLKKQVKKKARK